MYSFKSQYLLFICIVTSAKLPYTMLGSTGLAISTSLEATNWAAILQTPAPNPTLVNCSPLPYKLESSSVLTDGLFYKHIPVRQKKVGKNALSAALHEVVPYIISVLESHLTTTKDGNGPLVIVHSYESVEIPVCICIAVLAKLFDYEGILNFTLIFLNFIFKHTFYL